MGAWGGDNAPGRWRGGGPTGRQEEVEVPELTLRHPRLFAPADFAEAQPVSG